MKAALSEFLCHKRNTNYGRLLHYGAAKRNTSPFTQMALRFHIYLMNMYCPFGNLSTCFMA